MLKNNKPYRNNNYTREIIGSPCHGVKDFEIFCLQFGTDIKNYWDSFCDDCL